MTLKHLLKYVLITSVFLFSKASFAQMSAIHSIGKENYRVLAIKNDTVRLESVSNSVELTKSTTIYLPNAFTPDQDGVNDKFGAIGINADNYELKIFNRWGELLFESSRIEHKWDGTHEGKPVPEGVYVYTLFAKEKATGKVINRSGTVTLLL